MNVFISRLSKYYGKIHALEDVSLAVQGGIFGLLGPNGAGKTTLMRILTTLLLPSSGRLSVDGIDVVKEPGQIRQQLGYLPQEFGFYRSLNAYETLDYIASMKNIPREQRKARVEAVLEEVNLQREARRRVGGYSGGMKQRLGIAQALLGDPRLMVVDEPTAGLDPEERIRFRNLLSRLSGQRTIVLSTHIVADIEACCTGVAVLDRGRLVFTGAPRELVKLAQGIVWQLEAGVEEWERIEGLYQVVSSRPQNGGLSVRLMAAENPLGRGAPAEPSMEDGYMAAIKGRRDSRFLQQGLQ